ncbi:hypothetical protein ACHAW6_004115 [Cyclotella cf. meneghiniana]
MQKQETCQEFAQDANVPISKELMAPSMLYNAVASCKPGVNGDVSHPSNICGSTGSTTGQLPSTRIMSQANAAVEDVQWSSQMITSLDNHANSAVQKNNRVEKVVVANKNLTDTIMKL